MSKKIGKNYMDLCEPLSKRLPLHQSKRGSCCGTVQTGKLLLGHPESRFQFSILTFVDGIML